MLALSIRQPYAELILQGRKRIEYRTVNVTKMLGRRFFIYAPKRELPVARCPLPEEAAARIWSDDLAVTPPASPRGGEHQGGVPEWMMELARELILGKLPTGVIVGSAVIERVTRRGAWFEWHLVDVQRIAKTRKPSGRPQPVWFKPF